MVLDSSKEIKSQRSSSNIGPSCFSTCFYWCAEVQVAIANSQPPRNFFFNIRNTTSPAPPVTKKVRTFQLLCSLCTSFHSGTSVIFVNMATSDSSNDHLIRSTNSQHPANLIPELCKKFWTLGWVTGKLILVQSQQNEDSF
jgi:hypothetical protein